MSTRLSEWKVYLPPEFEAKAELVGRLRHKHATENHWRDRNNFRGDPLAVRILGARTELGSKQPFDPIKWHEIPSDTIETPDLGDFIDVKGVKWHSDHLLVPIGTVKPHWAYLLTSAQGGPCHYTLFGWMWGSEVLQLPITEKQKGRPAYTAARDDPMMRDVSELVAVVRQRRAAA